MSRVCVNCKRVFEPQSDLVKHCSSRCRAAASRKRRRRELTASLDEATRAIQKVRQAVWGEAEDSP